MIQFMPANHSITNVLSHDSKTVLNASTIILTEQLGRERKKKLEMEEMELRRKVVAGVKKLAEVANARKAAVDRQAVAKATPKSTQYTPEMYAVYNPRPESRSTTRSILKNASSNKENILNLRDVSASPVEFKLPGSSAKGSRKTTSAISNRTVTSGYSSARTCRSYASGVSEKSQDSAISATKHVTYDDEVLTKYEDQDIKIRNNKHQDQGIKTTNIQEPKVTKEEKTSRTVPSLRRQPMSTTSFANNKVHIQTTKEGSSTTMTVLPSTQQKFTIPTPSSYSIPVS